ncbi:hypothetical protein ONA91_29810 [Micromonospora sp. DR5-3]|uniref:hypothetical protein n=1 Tax=unclassified Micromonospora TaxID=2617518 RepID=UPI0011D6626D|nr:MULTISPECIES: hypothetical protein [unclassified Micromonospora]MCW3818643.1 hypothetical protein [Micromonospora sp. DR5-3]TYC19769.1 hypothetical protein FXF52_34745 [Micromonospora sp. MP36]
MSRSCTTGWLDWVHGELWLSPLGLIRRRLSWSESKSHGLGPTVGTPLPESALGSFDLATLLAEHPTNKVIYFDAVVTAQLVKGRIPPDAWSLFLSPSTMKGMSSAREKPERLPPTPATVRNLYLKSGNLCALPSCQNLLLDVQGTFIGKIAHIEAASPGGPRFNANMSNEERRLESNLILVCANHHEEIDQQSHVWTVRELQRVKAHHEAIFANPALAILDSVRDWTEDQRVISTGRYERFRKAWDYDEEDFEQISAEIASTEARLRPLTRSARQVLVTVMKRGEYDEWSRTHELAVGELERAMRLDPKDVRSLCAELEKRKFARLEIDEYLGTEPVVATRGARDYGFMISDLASYSEKEGVDLAEIILGLRFDLLDEK